MRDLIPFALKYPITLPPSNGYFASLRKIGNVQKGWHAHENGSLFYGSLL